MPADWLLVPLRCVTTVNREFPKRTWFNLVQHGKILKVSPSYSASMMPPARSIWALTHRSWKLLPKFITQVGINARTVVVFVKQQFYPDVQFVTFRQTIRIHSKELAESFE